MYPPDPHPFFSRFHADPVLQLLGSAYLFGGTAEHLNDVYEDISTNDRLEHWTDSPSEIAQHDYRDYLGKKEYQRAFVDFFEDQLVLEGYDWKEVVARFLFDAGPKKSANAAPIFNCLTSGLGHPLIHLGYAYELNSREVAMEALGLAATCYSAPLAKLLDATPTPTYTTKDLFDVFAQVHGDRRLDSAFDHHHDDKLTYLLTDPTLSAILLDHWTAWTMTEPTQDFRQSQALATALLTASASSVGGHGYDFLLVHLLTTSHAVRILLPALPAQYHVPLVREWLLIALAIYIVQSRPLIKREYVTDVDLQGRDWAFVADVALHGKHRFDAHFVKACRAMREAERVWGSEDEYYLKGAVKLASEFGGWVFGEEE